MRSQLFDHSTPSVPTLTRGMMLGASGVTAPPLHTIGIMTALSTADGSFQDLLGKGQIDYDSSGYLYVCDTANNRVQRFIKNASGVFAYDSKCSSLSALGTSVNLEMIGIDRVRGQIHLASSSQNVTDTLVGVWNISSWPNLTTVNRVRSYGTASGSNGSGNLRSPLCLTLIGDVAIICSSAGDYRVIKYDHTTNTVLAQDTNILWKARFAANADGSKYYSGAQAIDTELGLWLMNVSTLVGTSRVDSGTPSGVNYTRRNYLVQGSGGDITDLLYYNGRIYVRLLRDGRVLAWETTADTFVDEFLLPGGATATESVGRAPGSMFSPQIQQAKIGVVLSPDTTKSDDFIAWSSNANNTAQQSFLTVCPMTVATASWSLSVWPTGTNTPTGLFPTGKNLSGEKYKVLVRKNGGSWVTFTTEDHRSAAKFSTLGTFVNGDPLEFVLYLSTWDRQDGNTQGITAVVDKLTPENISLLFTYSNSLDDNPAPASTAYEGDKIALETRLKNTTELAAVTIKYANSKISDPGVDEWIAIAITYSQAEEVSIGISTSVLRRYTGTFFVQVYAREGKGGGDAVRLADIVADRFRGQVLDSGTHKLRCLTPLLQDVGPDGKGHYQYNVAIPFRRDTQH